MYDEELRQPSQFKDVPSITTDSTVIGPRILPPDGEKEQRNAVNNEVPPRCYKHNTQMVMPGLAGVASSTNWVCLSCEKERPSVPAQSVNSTEPVAHICQGKLRPYRAFLCSSHPSYESVQELTFEELYSMAYKFHRHTSTDQPKDSEPRERRNLQERFYHNDRRKPVLKEDSNG